MSDSDRPKNENEDAASQGAAEADAHAGETGDAIERVGESDEAVEAARGEVVGAENVDDPAAAHIGVQRYVHAAFFASGMLTAFLSGKLFLSAWNSLADWPAAVQSLPQLIQYTEEERGSITLVMGAVVGVLLVLRYYRRPSVRSWATDVASELARVTWPDKDTVTNGTIVVLVAGAIATLYIALLDRLWGYLTNLIYGA